jgi:predicted esterase
LSAEQAALHTSTFNAAMQAHTAGKYDESIAGFTKCLGLIPEDATAAYNIACGYSLKRELDPAFEWLDKAAAWGFGTRGPPTDTIALAEKQDTDMEPLRGDPRFAKVIEALKLNAKAVEAYADAPLYYVPERLKAQAELAVLVLLHDLGSTKDELFNSPWKELADELGLALVLPSARIPSAGKPERGMSWFSSLADYTQAAWKFESTVNAALDGFKKLHALDKAHVFLAGEGQGGVVAFNVAVSAPGLYRGVIAFDAPLSLNLARARAANAAKLDFRGRVFLNTTRMFGAPAGMDLKPFIAALEEGLTGLKLSGVSITLYEPRAAAAQQRRELAAQVLRGWLAPRVPPPK